MEIIGQKVSHKSLGLGSIVWYGEKNKPGATYITVSFETKKADFPYPAAFENFLLALDDAFNKTVADELVLLKQKEVEKENDIAKFSPIFSKSQKHKSLSYCAKNTFIFTEGKIHNVERGRYGFATYDNEDRLVAVAAMHTDRRGAAYGQAELCFFSQYVSEFGEWRLISINKQRMSFDKLSRILKEQGMLEVTIDPRKGS